LISFPENFAWKNLTENEYIGLDEGFKGYQRYWRYAVLPFIYSNDNELKDKHLQFNNNFKSIYTVIENVFCAMKKRRICKERLRVKTTNPDHEKKIHHMIWVVIAGFVKLVRAPLKSFS
jgi:hypothetical protein